MNVAWCRFAPARFVSESAQPWKTVSFRRAPARLARERSTFSRTPPERSIPEIFEPREVDLGDHLAVAHERLELFTLHRGSCFTTRFRLAPSKRVSPSPSARSMSAAKRFAPEKSAPASFAR